MATRYIEQEVQQALECIENKQNFILTGGAGSGKTYSLVSMIEKLGIKYPTKSIVCITYTNNAVSEIRSRLTNANLWVSTIHEFIWNVIKKYQIEIKETIVELIKDDDIKIFKFPSEIEDTNLFDEKYFENNRITYDEYYSLKNDAESKIGHDHLLIIAEKMFDKYPKLSDVLKDTSNFIFIDEYQDTDPRITKIFLEHINKSKKQCVVGFFGDSMQAIYDTGVGSINDENLRRISKMQNRRNPQSVITLANKFRNDSIKQVPSADYKAPNMGNNEIIQGTTKFVYGYNLEDLEHLKQTTLFQDWNFKSKETKELWLVHKANAKMAGFENLYELYNSDLLLNLIDKIKEKIKAETVVVTGVEIFGDIVDKARITKGRGKDKLLVIEDCDFIERYSDVYQSLKNEPWEKVSNYRINDDSLLAYKLNGLTGNYEAKPSRDRILRKLDNVYELIESYKSKDYKNFLKKSKFKVKNVEDKKFLQGKMNDLINFKDKKIEDVLNLVNDFVVGHSDELFDDFISDRGAYLWERIKNISFDEYVKSIEYQKEYLPFATQHSVKGSEYDNVLVVLDNANWTKYNFDSLFINTKSKDSVCDRTKKLFYVCITRAKRNLVVYMPTSDSNVIKEAKILFGEENVFNVDNFIVG